jgi:ABC-type branched-subunit amino acid transport system substrate-binding protein
MIRKKSLLIFTLTVLIAALSLSFTMLRAQEGQPVFRIGVLDDERGPISNGARLAVAEINESGGVEGADGTLFRLELVIQPYTDTVTFNDAVTNIDRADVIAVLGPETNEQVLTNLPVLQSLGIPVLIPATGDTLIASDSTGSLIRTRAAERWHGAALADYIVNQLGINNVLTIQLDRNSTASRVGFSVALGRLPGPPVEQTLLLEDDMTIADLVAEVIANDAQVAVAYGAPDLVSQLYSELRAAGWFGLFGYNDAANPAFKEAIPFEELRGILGTTTWPVGARSSACDTFLLDFVRAYGTIPGQVEAASYDSIQLIAAALGQPGVLSNNLRQLQGICGVQGILNPGLLEGGETSNNVSVIQLSALGGADIAAQYRGTELITDEPEEIVEIEPTITPTPTPDGVVITIRSGVQNVRTGPGLDYDILGQLRQGEQARVIGATTNFDWVVIEFRGQQGWLATYLLDVFGNRSTVPVIAPPPTPTPGPATATPTPPAIPDIIVLAAAPTVITRGVPTSINVTVRNNGGANAGPFAIAATFQPDGIFMAFTFEGGLPAGAQQTVTLGPITLGGATGNYDVVIVADLNAQVTEGAGEDNNDDFILFYKLDQQLLLLNSTTLGTGSSVDLEGNIAPQPDISYTGAGLNTVGACSGAANCIGLISPTLNWDTSHYDAITSGAGVNTTFIPNAALTPGATIGVLTAEGRRAVIRIDNINPGVSVTFTYRVYQ